MKKNQGPPTVAKPVKLRHNDKILCKDDEVNGKLHKVTELVKKASRLMLTEDYSVESKGTPSNFVTSADVAVQEFLMKELTALLPGSGFNGEENNQQDTGHTFTWVVDPIDGTCNFTRHLNQSAISVGLLEKGKMKLGVVYNPFLDDLFCAEKGKGAFLNGKPIHVSDTPFESGLLCTAMSLYRKELAPVCFRIIEDAYGRCNDVRRFGSCALELCYLAAGKCDLYFEIRVFPWDYTAGHLILEEAGGILTSLDGRTLTHDRPTPLIGANNAENHRILTEIVGKYLKGIPY